MKHNEKFFEETMEYVVYGNNRERALNRIYLTIDNVNWRKYARELCSRMKGVATPEQTSRWNEVMEEVMFRAVQW